MSTLPTTVCGAEPASRRGLVVRLRAVLASHRTRRAIWAILVIGVAGMVWGAVLGMVIPAVRAERRIQCMRNLKQLGVACHEYHEANGSFPAPSIRGRDGRPLLSWRVAILPQLGHRSLYERFRLDEPWDSPHNLPLLKEIPPELACPSLSGRSHGLTNYQVVVGPKNEMGSVNTPFEPNRGAEIREFIDGTSFTVLVAESSRSVPWTKPDDLTFREPLDAPLPAFGSGHEGGFHVLFADGSTRFLKHTIIRETLRGLLTLNGNEVLSAA
jgi:prepilin-type processing-associated H-X9-DG protein